MSARLKFDSWKVPPLRYLENRPIQYTDERLFSQYVPVRDGIRLAVDVHLPGGDDTSGSYPVVMILTPYYRRFALRSGSRNNIDDCPTIAFYRDTFVPRGYALVAVDVRGAGASFGARDGFRSPTERLDHYDIADWVSRQSWCSGRIGATGISYPGAAADFLASTCHPAVKAVAPLFAVWDTWLNHLYPGGVMLNCVTKNYGELAEGLDQDKRELIPPYSYFNDPDFAGPAPVDEDHDGELLACALYQHKANFDMQDFAQQLRFRDDGLSDDPDYTSASISPYHYANRDADSSTAYYSVSGWMDGGGYTTGTIQRYLWLNNPESRLLLGPWDHGARSHSSPWRTNNDPQQPIIGAAVLRFFDKHLLQSDKSIDDEKPIHYFTMGEEKWKAADTWPPPANEHSLFPGPSGTLSRTPSTEPGEDYYKGDYGCGTGFHSRYDRLYIQNVETYYDDWDGREEKMLCYTGEPIYSDIEVTGHPWVDLYFSASEKDCTFFVYLSDVTPGGKSIYITEGVFRVLHRRPGQLPENVPETGPTHSFRRTDAMLLTPAEATKVSFELLPTSYLFRSGHRVRISIALADSDHFTRIPAGRPPELNVYRSLERQSRVVLPVVV